MNAYLAQVKKWCPHQPVIHIDDSDAVKPDGYKFESLGWVRDGSKSTATKNISAVKEKCCFMPNKMLNVVYGGGIIGVRDGVIQ